MPDVRSAELPVARFETAGAANDVEALLARVLQAGKDSDRMLPEDAEDDEAALRRLQQRASDALATEGYFSPRMILSPDPLKQAPFPHSGRRRSPIPHRAGRLDAARGDRIDARPHRRAA